jgi:hypothetical protein
MHTNITLLLLLRKNYFRKYNIGVVLELGAKKCAQKVCEVFGNQFVSSSKEGGGGGGDVPTKSVCLCTRVETEKHSELHSTHGVWQQHCVAIELHASLQSLPGRRMTIVLKSCRECRL